MEESNLNDTVRTEVEDAKKPTRQPKDFIQCFIQRDKKKSTFTQRDGRSVLLKWRANSFWLLKSSAGWKALSTVIISLNPNPSSRNDIEIVGNAQ
ncbi:unnamed protein product [Calypogeia fissa]